MQIWIICLAKNINHRDLRNSNRSDIFYESKFTIQLFWRKKLLFNWFQRRSEQHDVVHMQIRPFNGDVTVDDIIWKNHLKKNYAHWNFDKKKGKRLSEAGTIESIYHRWFWSKQNNVAKIVNRSFGLKTIFSVVHNRHITIGNLVDICWNKWPDYYFTIIIIFTCHWPMLTGLDKAMKKLGS